VLCSVIFGVLCEAPCLGGRKCADFLGFREFGIGMREAWTSV